MKALLIILLIILSYSQAECPEGYSTGIIAACCKEAGEGRDMYYECVNCQEAIPNCKKCNYGDVFECIECENGDPKTTQDEDGEDIPYCFGNYLISAIAIMIGLLTLL